MPAAAIFVTCEYLTSVGSPLGSIFKLNQTLFSLALPDRSPFISPEPKALNSRTQHWTCCTANTGLSLQPHARLAGVNSLATLCETAHNCSGADLHAGSSSFRGARAAHVRVAHVQVRTSINSRHHFRNAQFSYKQQPSRCQHDAASQSPHSAHRPPGCCNLPTQADTADQVCEIKHSLAAMNDEHPCSSGPALVCRSRPPPQASSRMRSLQRTSW